MHTESPVYKDGQFVLVVTASAPRSIHKGAFTRVLKEAERMFVMALADNDLKMPNVDYIWPMSREPEVLHSSDMSKVRIYMATHSRPPISQRQGSILYAH